MGGKFRSPISNPLLCDKMVADEVLTGKKKHPVESTPSYALYSYMGKPVSKEILDSVFKKKPIFPELNPKPSIKIVKARGKDRKARYGLEVGLDFSF